MRKMTVSLTTAAMKTLCQGKGMGWRARVSNLLREEAQIKAQQRHEGMRESKRQGQRSSTALKIFPLLFSLRLLTAIAQV